MFGICHLSVVPCRKEPSDRSEMVTQLLFGETIEVLEEQEKWCLIKASHDEYECWIDKKQFTSINEQLYHQLQLAQRTYINDLVQIITNKETGDSFPVLMGSTLPQFNKRICTIDDHKFLFEGSTISPEGAPARETLIENACLYMHTPYLWGGRSPFGIDCSGFTQMIYKLSGIVLKRDAWQQATMGIGLNFVEEAEPGDLAFFDNEEGKIIHVGIILGENKIIHASGQVRIDKFDHHGIYHEEKKKYTHTLRIIKNVIPPPLPQEEKKSLYQQH